MEAFFKHIHCSICHSLVIFSTSWEESQPQPVATLWLFGSAGLCGACASPGLVNQDDHVPTQRFRSTGRCAREQAAAATVDNLHCSGKQVNYSLCCIFVVCCSILLFSRCAKFLSCWWLLVASFQMKWWGHGCLSRRLCVSALVMWGLAVFQWVMYPLWNFFLFN